MGIQIFSTAVCFVLSPPTSIGFLLANGMNETAAIAGEQTSAWRSFKGDSWRDEINVRDFIQNNYTAYKGDESFLEGPTERTSEL